MNTENKQPGVDEYLQLDNQLCFPLYASSRMITRFYQPLLEKLGLTYPQYIVLLVLWEHGIVSVKEIGERLMLNSNTLTPLLKRMEELGLIERSRSQMDERIVLIALTSKGSRLKDRAHDIPRKLADSFDYPAEKLLALKHLLDEFLIRLREIESAPTSE